MTNRRRLTSIEKATRQKASWAAYEIEKIFLPRIGAGIATPEKVAMVGQLHATMLMLREFGKRGRL